MRQKGFAPILIVIIIALIVVAGAYYLGMSHDSVLSKPTEKPVSTATGIPARTTPTSNPTNDPTANWKTYNFEKIKLTLKVPPGLTVESSSPNGNDFTAYIQNEAFNSGKLEDSYQLYIIWQKATATSQLEIMELKSELIPTSIEVVTISGYPAIKGQIKGERNRFVTYIITNDGQKIALFTAQPTEENKKLTDQILSTFKFTQ